MGRVAHPRSTVAAVARRLQRMSWRGLTPRRSRSRIGSAAMIAAGGLAALVLIAGLARYRRPRGWVVR
jgi:hypothetical protein